MKNRRTQGFTLIELLIVIAIIGILAAVLIPNLLNARRSANNSAAQSYLRNAIAAAEAYRSNYGTALTSSTVCSDASVLGGSFPPSVTACQIQQNQNATVGFVTSVGGRSYRFDGSNLGDGAASLPSLP